MTFTEDLAAPPVDLARWPDLAAPAPARVRSAVARLLLRQIARRAGLRIDLPGGWSFGPPEAPALTVRDERAFFRRVGRDGKIGLGEAFMARDWDAPDLVAALEPLARNVASLVPSRLQSLRRFYDAAPPDEEDNDRLGASRNIARHYDLSNDLFEAFLDPTMTYSAALFAPGPRSRETLETAQLRKIDRLLDACQVTQGTELLEIGTGWGELALRAAARGAQVTTVTLSQEQATLARRRLRDAGLAGTVDVRVEDYRDVTGRYDAIVSVEMIEAVGARWWPTYFRTLDELLRPEGRVGLQAILMPHDRMLASRRSWTWIHKYVFPGGQLPSTHAIHDNVFRHTTLRVVDETHFAASYAQTLQRWREAFTANAETVRRLGFDETFQRMWTFYLAYCEAGFRAGYLDVAQFTLSRAGAPA